MERQLAALLGDFVQREEKNENNLWIVKPWNMARTIDTSIVESLPALARLVETGPKIGQKYIEKPALFKGRKFDLRYIVLLRSLQPLEIFLCNVFWVSAIFLFLLLSCFVFLLILMVTVAGPFLEQSIHYRSEQSLGVRNSFHCNGEHSIWFTGHL